MNKEPSKSSNSNNLLNKRKLIESEVDIREMIIIDNGTHTIKIGRSGVDYPSIIIPTVAGHAHAISENDPHPTKKAYFGTELTNIVEDRKYNIEFVYPVVESAILETHLEDMIALWEYVIVEVMGIDPTTADLLIVDSPANSKDYKARIIPLLFEKLKIASVLFINSASLSLFSVGATIGLVTEIGHGSTTCVPVYEGYVLGHALQRSKIAGQTITTKFEEQLNKNHITVQSKHDLHYASTIAKLKETTMKVSFDYEKEMKTDERSQEERIYELPDGSIIELPKETVYGPAETLFDTAGTGKSVPTMIQSSLELCNEGLRQELVKKAIFCGGTSLLKGVETRMEKELNKYGHNMKTEFDWQRKYSAWIGGSMVGSLSTFQMLAIGNKDNLSYNDIIKRIL